MTFWGWNRGKRSVVLDVGDTAGAAALQRLCAEADVVIECGALAVDLAALRAADPALVTVSISPFGSTGPKSGWPATDLTVNAAGCQLAITGDEDRPPVRTAVPQAFLHAAADAAVGALLALTERAASGRGQHVEVSAQRSMLQATQSYALAVPLGGSEAKRMSGGVKTGGLDVQLLLAVQGRLFLGDVPVRRLHRAVHAPPDEMDPRGGLLRRGHPGQGLAGLRQPALRRA